MGFKLRPYKKPRSSSSWVEAGFSDSMDEADTIRIELEAEGYRVKMTKDRDEAGTFYYVEYTLMPTASDEAKYTFWRVSRGSSSVPIGPDHPSKNAAEIWAKRNIKGFYNIQGY